MATLPTYILITPARNEAQYIELTLQSMAAQTYRPLKWIIVSDGSTDGTDDLVRKYAADNPWIELLRMPERAERHFAGKVHAFNAGYARAKEFNPEIIGNLDGDVSIEPDHFQYLLSNFAENPELGVGGSPFREGSLQYDYRFSNIENVWGGCQLFRRECFDAIGGYTPVKGGGSQSTSDGLIRPASASRTSPSGVPSNRANPSNSPVRWPALSLIRSSARYHVGSSDPPFSYRDWESQSMKPTIGRIVHYTLTDADAAAINVRAPTSTATAPSTPRRKAPSEHPARQAGRPRRTSQRVAAGDIFPALVVRDWDTAVGTVNLQLFLDGSDSYWGDLPASR